MKKGLGILVLAFFAATLSFGQGKVVAKEWTIPFLDCLTGPIASIGEYLLWGATYAAKEINAAGGISGKPVKVVGVDTALDPQKGSVEMARIVSDTLVALGPVPEPVIMAAMPIAVENEMMSVTASTSMEYAEKFFPWTVSWFPPTDVALSGVAAAWAKQFSDMKKVVQFIEPYGPWPDLANAHAKGLKAAGVQLLNPVSVPSDAVSFGPLVVKALEQKPDGIIFVCNGAKVATMIKDIKNRGWKKLDHMLVFWSADTPELYSTGGASINGVQIYNANNPDLDTPRWNAFRDAYGKDHNGEQPPSLSTNYYDAVYMIKRAIEETGVTGDPKKLKAERKKIAEFCANMKNFNGLLFSWDMKDGIPTNKPTYLLSIQDGAKKLVKEVR